MPPVTHDMIPGLGAYHVVIGADRWVVRAYWVGRVISHNVIHFHLILSQTLLFGVHLHIDAPIGFAIFHASTCDVYSPSIVPSFDITAIILFNNAPIIRLPPSPRPVRALLSFVHATPYNTLPYNCLESPVHEPHATLSERPPVHLTRSVQQAPCTRKRGTFTG